LTKAPSCAGTPPKSHLFRPGGRHHIDVYTRQVVLLDHRGDQTGFLPLSTLICHRKSQTNRTRPCVPSHLDQIVHHSDHRPPPDVLVIPTRPVSRISDLTSDELKSLMESVKTVGTVVEKAYNGDSLTVACQVRKCLFDLQKSSNLQLVRNT